MIPDRCGVGPPGRWIVDPDGAVVHAGLVRHYGSSRAVIAGPQHRLSHRRQSPDRRVRGFEVLDELPMREKVCARCFRAAMRNRRDPGPRRRHRSRRPSPTPSPNRPDTVDGDHPRWGGCGVSRRSSVDPPIGPERSCPQRCPRNWKCPSNGADAVFRPREQCVRIPSLPRCWLRSPLFSVLSPAGAATAQSGCDVLGGAVQAGNVCQVKSTTANYHMDIRFPVDYPDEGAMVAYLTQNRDGFVNVAKHRTPGTFPTKWTSPQSRSGRVLCLRRAPRAWY